MESTSWLYVLLTVLSLVTNTDQNVRQKRQLLPDQPRIITENGHLIFQSGLNHNITFRSGSGGVFIDNLDLKFAATQARATTDLINNLQNSLRRNSTRIVNRLSRVEDSVRRIPGLTRSVNNVTSSINNLRTQGQNNQVLVNNRLTQVEARTASIPLVDQLQTQVTSLRNRVVVLENAVSSLTNNNNNDSINRRIEALETTVRNLQTLLTANECLSNPCLNGGTCVDMYNGYFCRCPSNWQGPRCTEDVNECALYAGTDMGCQNGATCVNTYGGFSCNCATNWYGIHCSERHNDCTGASHMELCGHGTCINEDRVVPGQPRYRCICQNGWTTSGSSPACNVDIDECATGAHCSVNPPVQCFNMHGSFACGLCPTGYTGNGYGCSDTNECAVNNGGCSTSPRVSCVNTIGSRSCGPCPPGYQGDGVTCSYVGLCNINNGGCHPSAACTDDTGGYGTICTCPFGYVGSGVGQNGCVQQSQAGACASNPCQNGALCVPSGSAGFFCTCRPGFSGTTCSNVVDACSSNPCQNGGTCISQRQAPGFTCQCSEDYTGNTCEQSQQDCGGYLQGQTGSFRYPRTTGVMASHRVNCAWVITTSANKILSITFPSFSLEYHPECNYDFLQIHDGPSASSYMIGKYCGSQAPNGGSLNSTHNQMYFWFKSDATIASDGFEVRWTSESPTCGGYLNGSSYGTISSPGYPGNYPINRDCVWIVSVSPDSNIMFTFAHLALEAHPNCSYDYLEFRDGETDSSPLINKFCTSVTSSPIQTTGPYAYIKFHSDISLSDRGFHITYAALTANRQGCGGSLSGPSGEISSPGYPSPYQHNIDCVWVINVTSGSTVQLTILDLDLEGDPSCSMDYLRIRDGSDQMAPLVGSYCGTQIPAAFISSSNVINLEFRSDVSISGRGFRAQWTTACGGRFFGTQGQIQSPNWPGYYPHNRNCDYRIEVPDLNTIRFEFTAFGLEGGDNCAFDYIGIYDGANADAPIIGSRLCGATTPSQIIMSTGNSLFVRFVTDGSVNNHGFQARFSAVPGGLEGCGGVLNRDMGAISSPGHPNQYPHGVSCTWYINVTPGLVIRLTFSAFTFEIASNTVCYFDYVAVYDNSTVSEQSLLGKYCGLAVPPILTSTDNVMTIFMQSDSSIAREGFTASYIAINASLVCGSSLTTATGVITSPSYPNQYRHNAQCEWTITIADGSQISLNITDMDIETDSNCNSDFLEIRNGGYLSSPLIQKFCGQVTPSVPILSHSNRLYVRFKSDSFGSGRGFRLEYTSAASGCGGDLTTPTGGIISPNYPHSYPHQAECQWSIIVSKGSTITLFFVDFEIDNRGACHFGFLKVYEGVPAGRSLGTLCGSSIPSPITTVSNRMWLTYRTDVFLSGRGFRAQYHANCNNRLTGNSGVIESPNFPNPYFHNTNCTWTIEAPIGNKINVSFAVFNLEGSRGCFYDRLQIRDAQNSQSRQMITLCGNDIPDNIQSNSSQLWINFLSDASIANEGFRLEWVVDGCGGNIYGSSGVITSPNYPNHYPSQRECQWLITVDTGNMIEMTITNFDLESSSNCYWDALEVYAGSDKQGSQIAKLCHRQVSAQTLHTTGSTAFIVFRSDSSVSGTGFRLTYRALSGGCGGNFTARTATITSINYPNNYEHNTECEWNITVAQGYVVVLNITDFQLEGGHLCTYDYLSLYDGSDVNATLITKLCGATLPAQTVYRSTGNQMYIRMRTDSSVTYRGFKATYDTGCGGTRNADIDGELISPTYLGSNWSPFCIWIISSDFNNRRISLTFTHMDLNSNCSYEYVAVNDGRESVINETSVPQNAYCGNSVPATITSEGSALNVVSKNSRSRHRPNFRAVYSSAYSSCGGEFTSDRGTFTSPSFPDGYPVSIECVWLIKTSPGNSVQLSFPNFQLDPLGGINDDYLEIRSPNVSGAILGRWFGTTAPANLTSLSNVWVKFRSNEDTTAPGFKAVYSNSFGGNLFGDSGQVASPRYPLFYPANSNYRWTILASQNKRIRVSFSGLSIELESDISSCIYDYVQIFDGTEQDGVSLGRFCGSTLPSPVYSINNLITVVFSSDSYRQDSGFLMDWLAVPPEDVPTPAPSVIPATPIPGCGGQLVASETQQNLTSPGYPSVYEHNLDCSWTISVPVGNTIIVNIISIDMEGSGGCYYDYLRLSNGGLSPFRPRFNSNFRSTFCGRTGAGTIIQSVGNTMIVTFHTDHSISMSGFVLTYEIGCGGFSTLATGVISSTNYPSNYKANQNCTWSTQVQPGRTIRLEFENQFNIADTGVCNDDYLLLLNGGTVQSPPLFVNGTTNTNGRYCGSSKPQVMETSSNFLVAQFISDATNEDIGFSFTYSTVSVACGGQLRLTHAVRSGNFTSPNYPGDYPHNVDCVWVIIAPASQRVRVDFEETFGIEAHPGCRFDFVEFRDGGTTNSQRIGNALCGNSLPGTVLSTGNILLARFRTDSSVPHTGFKAKYSIATCGGRIIADRGVLTSPNYPGRYSNNADCEWSIVGPVGHFLTINITDSRLQYTINCTADSLVIRDGNSTDNILFQFCEHLTLQSVLTSDNTAYIRFRSDGSVTDQGFRIVFQASVEECGGQRNTPTGIIQSPNYPGHYAHRRLCVWEITVPIARRVTLTFNDIQIEGYSGGRCSWDSVQVYNGYIQQSPTIGRYCNVNPGTIESSGNTMRVQFQTDGRGSSGRGFQATYTSDREAECGGYIVESPGNITSPGFENATYNHNVQCLWNLQNRLANSSIRLQFTNMSLEENPSCWFDYVEIREGTNINGEFIGRFCGHVVPVAPIILSASEVWIRFRSDISISHIGFNLLYEFTECGGIITEPQGVITSPNYPNNYVSNTVACAWKIVAPEGTKIRVNFTDFNFETNTGCDSDNLQLQNGGLSDSPVIGKYCGTDLPSSFLSQSNKLRLTLQSNLTSRARRFRIVYSFESGGCGGLLHSNQGSLSSPNYPSSYPHNVECTWDINVPVGFMINLRFNPPFDLEARDCVNDYVEVFDTFYNGSLISLGRWCQNIEPPNQRSTSNRLVVVFRSDATTNGNGFSASWDVACGGVFTNPTGVVLSPHYPSPYPNNLICHYTIGPGPDHHVLLRFTDFELEGRPSTCSYDYVQILQGATTVDYMQWPYYYRSYRHRYCGTDSPGVLLSSGQIILQFNTDHSLQYKGFRAEYTSEECGGVFTDPSGTFSTPHHPNNYMNNMNCSWNITVASNRIIKFKFQTFETERHHSCMYDYISFYDGSDTNSSMIGRYCGNMQNVPEFIRSTGNHMYITFITDFSFTLGGFSGTYETTYGPQQGCGGALRQSSGTFTSVDGDSDGLYESNLHCEWWIFVNDNKVVSLTITGLDIEASQDCSRDSLKVYDGLNKDDPLLGTFCGRTLPQQPIWASSNVIFVVFETDDLISGRGFNASFTENNALCGGAYNATTNPVTISSPNYPNSTGTAVHCSWIIDTGDSSKQVRLIVSDFQLQVSSNCVDEHLTFRDRPLGNNGQELTYCGNTIPPHFDSKGAQVKIIYFLSTTSTSRGFQLSYQIADCNRNITLPNGRITSPGYPGVYQRNSDCTILVTSPENTTLSFYFKFFEMERHPNCNWDYLEIKNSMSTTVSKECGYTIPSPVFLSDNVATLRFKTDSSIQHPGYDVTFMSSTQGSGCGGNMTGLTAGAFTSPGYPNSYMESSTCTWNLTPPARRPILWRISFMNTPDGAGGNCDTDYLTIYLGSTTAAPLLQRFCGLPEPSSNQVVVEQPLLIQYVSTGNGTAPVFRFEFDTNPQTFNATRTINRQIYPYF